MREIWSFLDIDIIDISYLHIQSMFLASPRCQFDAPQLHQSFMVMFQGSICRAVCKPPMFQCPTRQKANFRIFRICQSVFSCVRHVRGSGHMSQQKPCGYLRVCCGSHVWWFAVLSTWAKDAAKRQKTAVAKRAAIYVSNARGATTALWRVVLRNPDSRQLQREQ